MWGVDMDVNNRCVPGSVAAGSRFSNRNFRVPVFSIRGAGGFTLIEVMVTLAVSAVLMTLGVPLYHSLIDNSQLTTQVNSLSASLALARSAAIRQGSRGMICKSRDGISCTGKGNWSEGWIVFVDQDLSRQRDGNEPLLYAQESTDDRLEIRYRGFPTSNYVIYRSSGMAKMNGTFVFCVRGNPAQSKAVIVSWTGRPRISDTYRDGSALDCS